MSNTVTGTVEIISEKPRGTGIAYGIKMSDGVWYGHGFVRPKFQKGDNVTFEYEMKGQYANIVVRSVQVANAASQPQQAAQPTQSAPAAPAAPNATQISIQYQSSRKDALEFVKLAMQADALPLPTKKSDRMDALQALVEDTTGRYYAAVSETVKNGGVVLEELEKALASPQQEDF